MKKCSKCKKSKKITEFTRKNKSNNKRESYCKSCSAKRRSDYYNKTPERREKQLKTFKNWRDNSLKNNSKKLLEYLKSHPCLDCGESNPIVLEFDHIKNKKERVSKMTGRYTWETVAKEIAKCEVRCANCHRIKTAKQFGFYKKRGGV